jgi:transcriptional regulator with GAF, ATPase, and Fis domain
MPQNFDQLVRQRSALMWLLGIISAATCAALVFVSWTGEQPMIQWEQRWPALVGLCGLVLLFVLYVQHKHRQLSILEAQLRDVAVREAAMQARFSELSSLFDVSTQLQLRLDLKSMLEVAAQRLIPCLDAHSSSVMLFDEVAGVLEVRAMAGVDAVHAVGDKIKSGEGMAGHVFETGETLNLTAATAKQRFGDLPEFGRQVAAALCVPMLFRNNPIGVISVTRATGEAFGQPHAQMLVSFAEHCAATVIKTNHHYELLESVRKTA